MTETISFLYKCYLGKNLMYRTAIIYEFVKDYGGAEFFLKHSTEIDTILDFIRRCEDKDLL